MPRAVTWPTALLFEPSARTSNAKGISVHRNRFLLVPLASSNGFRCKLVYTSRFAHESSCDVRFVPCVDSSELARDMCGRLRVGKGHFHVAELVGAAMCSACLCGSYDRWP